MINSEFGIKVKYDGKEVDGGVSLSREQLRQLGDEGKKAGEKVDEGLKKANEGVKKTAVDISAALEKLRIRDSSAIVAEATQIRTALNQIKFSGNADDVARASAAAKAAMASLRMEYDGSARSARALAPVVGAATGQVNQLGMSAKATAAAMRGVPAQFTDIFTSLQGGQAPLTVLLQQGGQLKDMFGGVGNAARALGGYVAGLVNPVTIVGAVVASFAVAAYKGAEESRELAKSLILSGNAAGQSVDSIYRLAEGIEASARTTKGAAAEAVSQAAATGKVSAANLARVAEASILMQKATGAAVGETIAQFAELGKSPVQASQKLQAQYGYLTAEVYRQIKALEDQGKTQEAGELAQQAFAKALTERSNKIIDDLGFAEKAWIGLGNVAKKTWDEMLGLGRTETLEEKLAAAIRARDGYTEERGNGNMGTKTVPGNPDKQAEVESLQKQIAAEKEKAEQKKASIEATKVAVAWESEAIKYLDKQAQKANEILRVKNLMTAAGKDEAYQARVLAEIEKKYAEKKAAATPQENQYKQLSEEIDKYLAQLNAEIEGEQKLTKGQSIAAEVRRTWTKAQQDARAPALALITAGEQTLALRQEQTKAEEAAYKETQRRAADLANAAAATEKETESIRAHTAELGLSAEQIDLVRAARVDDLITLQEHELAELDAAGTCTAYSVALRENVEALKARRSALQEQSFRQAEVEAEKTIAEARKRGWEETDRIAREVFASIADDGGSAMEKIGKTLEKALLSAAYEATLQPLVFSFYTSAMGALGGGTGTPGAGGLAGSLSSGGTLLSTGKSAYDLYTGGSGLYSNFALSGMGSALGLSTGLSASLGVAGGAGSVMGGSAALAAAEATSLGGASALTGLGSAIGTAIPIIGGVLAIGSLLGGLFGGKKRADSQGAKVLSTMSADGEYTSEASGAADKYNTSLVEPSEAINKNYLNTVSGLFSALDNAQSISFQTRMSAHGRDGDKLSDGFELTVGDQVAAVVSHAYGKISWDDLIGKSFEWAMSEGIQSAVELSTLDDSLKALFEPLDGSAQVGSMVNNISALATYSDELNDVWGISIKQAAEVATLTSESTDALIANVAAIAQFSAAQRSAGETLSLTRTDLQDAFDALSNADFPKTLADYDAAMKAVDATVEGSIETFADLFTLRESFAQYQAAIDGIKAATSSAVFDLRTDAEKLRLRNADLASIAAAAGVSIPRSAADLVALADAIDYTSESGVNLALALPSLVAAFNAVDEASAAAGISATTAAAILERAFSLASDGVDSAFDALSRSVDAEKKRLDAAYAAQAASLSDAADAARTVRDNISALSDRLTRAVSSNAVDTVEFAAQRRLAAQQSLDTALAAAQSGQSLAPFSAAIETAIGDLAQPSEDLYETFVDYARAQGRAAGTLAQLDVQAKAQKSVADLTLDAINASIRAAEVQHTQDIAALDRTLENAQAQLDALNGIDGSVLAVADAIAALTSAIAAAGALNDASLKPDTVARVGGQRAMLSSNGALLVGDTVSATNGYTGSVADATSIITAVFGATAPADFKAAAKSVGLSAAMIDELYSFAPGTANLWAQSNGLKGFAHGGVASAGMYIAGEHGPELINASAATRIYPAEQTSALMDRLNSPANNANELLREIRELRKVIERQAEQLASIQSNTGTTAEILNSNTGGGGPSLVRMV